MILLFSSTASKYDNKLITVRSNYRLGATGWISSPGQEILPNAVMWDALAAIFSAGLYRYQP
jgi:carboxylesterase type B